MIDLHTHSNYSDGTVGPETLVRMAEQAGLSAIALCDHNTIDGLEKFLDAARGSAVEAIPGVEFSTDYGDVELHIVGLWIGAEHYGAVKTLLQEALDRKEESNRLLIEGLNRAGMALDYGRIKDATPGGLVNRAVIAAEMVRLGYTESVKAAFSNWLSPKHGYFLPPKRLDCFEVIRFIRSIGAVSVLAHPFLNLDEPELRVFLAQASKAGLDAMETRYSKFDEETSRKAKELAGEYGVLESGGSDFHGENKPDIRLGTGRGTLCVPEEFLTALKLRAARYAEQGG